MYVKNILKTLHFFHLLPRNILSWTKPQCFKVLNTLLLLPYKRLFEIHSLTFTPSTEPCKGRLVIRLTRNPNSLICSRKVYTAVTWHSGGCLARGQADKLIGLSEPEETTRLDRIKGSKRFVAGHSTRLGIAQQGHYTLQTCTRIKVEGEPTRP